MEPSLLMIRSTLSLNSVYPLVRLFKFELPNVWRNDFFAPGPDAVVVLKRPILFKKGLACALNKGPKVGMHTAMMPRYISSAAISPTRHRVLVQSGESLVLSVSPSRQSTKARVL
jgi:hypothetical protein